MKSMLGTTTGKGDALRANYGHVQDFVTEYRRLFGAPGESVDGKKIREAIEVGTLRLAAEHIATGLDEESVQKFVSLDGDGGKNESDKQFRRTAYLI
jgi:hypothetical protein